MKRLSAAMIILLLSVMFTIGGSMAYDNAVYGSQTSQSGKQLTDTAMASPQMLNVDFYSESEQSSADESASSKDYEFKTTEYWEPGYVGVSVLKLSSSKNVNYQIDISRVTTNDNLIDENVVLSDVIDVYCFAGNANGLSRNEVTSSSHWKGELYECLTGNNELFTGQLDTSTVQYITIALKMQENAGNQYQGKTVCKDGIKITVTATEIQ